MQLTPRYDAAPVIVIEGPASLVAGPAIAQRRRLAAVVASFDESQWSHESRCDGWSNRDVIVHLDSTNAFWTYSIRSGLSGEPTRFMQSFDPVASPAELVAASAATSTDEVLASFQRSTDSFIELLESLDEADWDVAAEAPPGHIAVGAVVQHALWDSWVHERDILLPLAEQPEESPEEIASALRYGAALSPAFAVTMGASAGARSGRLAVAVTDPELRLLVEIGESVTVRDVAEDAFSDVDLVLTGRAVDLLEALSQRQPLDQPVPDAAGWMLSGLAEVFDVAVD